MSLLTKEELEKEVQLHNSTISKTQDVALKNFKLGKYQEAINIYTKGIKFCLSLNELQIERIRLSLKLTRRPPDLKPKDPLYHPKFASLLDSRAACYIKISDYKKALKDAQNIVRVDPYTTKGHIRLGKVYELINEDKLAYEAYVKGLKYMDFGKKKFGIKYNVTTIQQMQEASKRFRLKIKEAKEQYPRVIPVPEASQSQPPSQSSLSRMERNLDPLIHLPFELLDIIFKQVPFKDVIRQCLSVSKIWYEVCSSLSIFDDIRIRPHCTFNDVSNCFTKVIKSKKLHHPFLEYVPLNSLKIGNTGVYEEKSIFRLLFHKSSIKILNTLDLQFNDISMKDIIDALKLAENGEVLIRNVTTLKLQCVFSPRYEEMLLDYLPNIKSLMLIPTYNNTIPKLTLPPNYQFKNFVTNLRQLYILGDIKQPYLSIPLHNLFLKESKQLINLENLQIIGYDFTKLNQATETYNFLQRFPKLRHLVLENNLNLTFRILLKNHDLLNFPKLKTFVLREREIKYVETLNIFEPTYLKNIFGNVLHLDLTGSSITYHGLKNLLDATGIKLLQLSIGLCGNLVFKNNGFVPNNPNFFNFAEFLNSAPNLIKLHLNQCSGFTDYTLRELINALESTKSLQRLRYLDLSFNDNLQGHSMIDLVELLPSLTHLVIHGSYIKLETIQYIEKKFKVKVESLIEKRSWKEYGVNTYDPFNV